MNSYSINKNKLFQIGLGIRVLSIFLLIPKIQTNWFNSFLVDFFNNPNIDPNSNILFGIIILSKSIMDIISNIEAKKFKPNKFKIYKDDKEPLKKVFKINNEPVRTSING